MSLKIIFEKKEIKDRVTNLTIDISDPIGSNEANATMRIADIIPITNDETVSFETLLYEAGARVLEQIGGYTDGVDYPYQVTDETDPEFPLSVVYEIELYSGAKVGLVIPIVQQAMTESLIYYIAKEWCAYKGYYQTASVLERKYADAYDRIKSGLKYGQRPKLTYRTL